MKKNLFSALVLSIFFIFTLIAFAYWGQQNRTTDNRSKAAGGFQLSQDVYRTFNQKSYFTFTAGDSYLSATELVDPWSRITVNPQSLRVPSVSPQINKTISLDTTKTTPMVQQLYNQALRDIQDNMVTKNGRTYFRGFDLNDKIYTRDISYAGILGLNELYPNIMKDSLLYTREIHKNAGFKVPAEYENLVSGVWGTMPVALLPDGQKMNQSLFSLQYSTDPYIRRTDDVVWLWAANNLLSQSLKTSSPSEWQWVYEWGSYFFKNFYWPFYDIQDGLFRGQATFVDIHHPGKKTTGYPEEWSIADCVMIKATSTNALYYKGMKVMAGVSSRLGKSWEAQYWEQEAEKLRQAMIRHLRFSDGTFAYYKDRWNRLSSVTVKGISTPQRDAFGSALVVLLDVVTGADAVAALANYPMDPEKGIPIFHPFFPNNKFYHNNSTWPYVNTIFLWAVTKADGISRWNYNAYLLGRTTGTAFVLDRQKHEVTNQIDQSISQGTYREVVDYTTGRVTGAGKMLSTAASFYHTCRQAGLIIYNN